MGRQKAITRQTTNPKPISFVFTLFIPPFFYFAKSEAFYHHFKISSTLLTSFSLRGCLILP